MYRIAAARPCDLPLLAAIEVAAATLLAGHAPASVLAETTTQADLENAQQRGQLWVALADGVPVGFARTEVLEPGIAHLEEIDVHPEHGRRGLGTRLVLAVCQWAATNGYSWVTLTTFRDARGTCRSTRDWGSRRSLRRSTALPCCRFSTMRPDEVWIPVAAWRCAADA